ncbi:hypothetical protein DPMN_000810 [Dreissena polymorpha]|uniref:Uncharacterized protein n=1 Tax=Dreissena polymorpha TaxID=45954 RepID=A0A9D4MKG7_DREPO|nr:hypothetical protein DPMN_000810 [Dreissena polymorpha]
MTIIRSRNDPQTLHSSACHHGFRCSGEKGCNLTIYDYLFGSLFVYPFTGTPCSRDPIMVGDRL